MGKYMKGKVMESPQPTTTLGVRTRARSLALQPNPELSYLQLRSRRLVKPTFQPKRPSTAKIGPANSMVRVDSVEEKAEGCFGNFDEVSRCEEREAAEFCDVGGEEASFDENNLDYDATERSTRESTPCSFIRNSEPIGTPGSTTRPTYSSSASRRAQSAQMGAIPTTVEMEEFFADFELAQQKLFLEKYNYDVMNDSPLSGRYEWVRVDN